jgi:hypothetical protein
VPLLKYPLFAANGVGSNNGDETHYYETAEGLCIALFRKVYVHAVHAEKHGWYGNKHANHSEDFDSAVKIVRAYKRVGAPNGV